MKDWGVSHRFAGSGDRAAIGNLVFDALRTRSMRSERIQPDFVAGSVEMTIRDTRKNCRAFIVAV